VGRKRYPRIPSGFPLSTEECRRTAELALAQSSLEPRTVVSRLLWLLDPGRKNGVRLQDHAPKLPLEEVARIIVAPRATIFEMIRHRTGLTDAFLERVYEEILTKGRPGDVAELVDLAEERILQEMKWWLTDLSFPAYYLQNTPPALMARQIMLNRSSELAGLDSETYERMKVSSTAADGTATHWVHKRRSFEVEEEIERDYYAGTDLINATAYAPLPNLLLYTTAARLPRPARSSNRSRRKASSSSPIPRRARVMRSSGAPCAKPAASALPNPARRRRRSTA
jgi:hypothetical protein